jgi:hypothetical protein
VIPDTRGYRPYRKGINIGYSAHNTMGLKFDPHG